MSNGTKFFLLASTFFVFVFTVIAPLIVEFKYQKTVGLEFQGVVEHIEWESRNHALPLFIIKKQNGSTIKINDGELSLKKGQLKVGDTFSKKTEARYCTINGTKTECVKEFVSFHDRLFNSRKKGV